MRSCHACLSVTGSSFNIDPSFRFISCCKWQNLCFHVAEQYSIVCRYLFLTHLPIHRHLGCLGNLDILNSTAVNIDRQKEVSLTCCFHFPSGYSQQWDWRVNSLRNLHTILHRGWTNSPFYQQCARVLLSPYSLCIYFLSFWWVMWSLIVILICISLVLINAEHFFLSPPTHYCLDFYVYFMWRPGQVSSHPSAPCCPWSPAQVWWSNPETPCGATLFFSSNINDFTVWRPALWCLLQ